MSEVDNDIQAAAAKRKGSRMKGEKEKRYKVTVELPDGTRKQTLCSGFSPGGAITQARAKLTKSYKFVVEETTVEDDFVAVS